jgi:hypothetical protein
MENKLSDVKIANKLLNLKDSASKRNIEFDLSINKVKQIMNTKRCYFTNEKLVLGDKNNSRDRSNVNHVTIKAVLTIYIYITFLILIQ